MFSDAVVSAVGTVVYTVLFLTGLYVYIALIRQISARSAPADAENVRTFGVAEAVVAIILISFLLLSVIGSVSGPAGPLSTRDLVVSLILTIAVLLILVGFLKLRGLDVDTLAGFSRIGIVRAVGTGALLLLAAYPLIAAADALTRRYIGDGSSKQTIVELFNGSQTIQQRIMIIVLAVAIAPIAEEFVFRFFIYGVLRRFIGPFAALVFNALLFAAVHTHAPSFAPLLVLGACFTLAYEWSGSILVSMTMHSLFNSLSLIFLAFPELSQQ
jgi:membrane protease YdiL (CAAX protease family)